MKETQVGWLDGVTIIADDQVIKLDPTRKAVPNTYTMISHAHGDHTSGLRRGVKSYLTEETRNILSSGGKHPSDEYNTLEYGKEVRISDSLTVTPHNAGHILGSAQFEIKTQDTTIVYTGDLNCRDMLTTRAAEPVPCDTLILETTYGSPNYIFPSLMETHMSIVGWIMEQARQRKTPVFQVYTVGKAQEVIKLVNKFTTIPVVTHPTISRINKAYSESGVELEYLDSESPKGEEALETGQCAYIIPSNKELPSEEKYSPAVATGWAVNYRPNNGKAAFPLSNHADFNQLIEYIEEAKPKRIFTVHGFKEDFVKHIQKRLKTRAQPITPLTQESLKKYL